MKFCHKAHTKWSREVGRACSNERKSSNKTTTTSAEIENNCLKQEGDGFHANTTKATLFLNLDNQDARRNELDANSYRREKETVPLNLFKTFSELYKHLPLRVMVLLEKEFQRALKQTLVSVDTLNMSFQLQGSSKERYGIPPRIRTVWAVDSKGSSVQPRDEGNLGATRVRIGRLTCQVTKPPLIMTQHSSDPTANGIEVTGPTLFPAPAGTERLADTALGDNAVVSRSLTFRMGPLR